MDKNYAWKWLILAVMTAISLVLVTPQHILAFRKPLPSDRPKITLGLDLVGGLRFVLEVDVSKLGALNVKDAQTRAMEVIRNRIDSLGVAEPNIQAEGVDRIVVELPGLKAADRERALNIMKDVAFLEFRMVHPKNDDLIRQLNEKTWLPEGFKAVTLEDPGPGARWHGGEYYLRDKSKDQPGTTEALVRERTATFHAPPGYELLLDKRSINGQNYFQPYYVNKKSELTGENLKSASVDYDQLNRPHVSIQLDSKGARKFWDLTKRYAQNGSANENPQLPRLLGVVLDGTLYSAPVLKAEIPDGRAIIEGNFTYSEASDLAIVLKAGSLPAPVKLVEEREVDASLGAASIASGKYSTLIGGLAVMIFMAGYYFLPGLVANVALLWNIILLPLALWVVGALLSLLDPSTMSGAISLPTLTLPGIAGIALTVGMAVDANVLIYERMREEQHAGKGLKGVIEAGYHKAFSAIFDSNMTTIISAVILFWLGSGAVRGFAVTLTAGIALSMYTALMVTRMVFELIAAKTKITQFRMLEMFKTVPRYDFIGLGKVFVTISLIVIFGSWGIMAYREMHGKSNLGVDFTGGAALSFQFTRKVSDEKIRDVVEKAGVKDAVARYQREQVTKAGGGAAEYLQVNVGFDDSAKAVSTIEREFQGDGFKLLKKDSVGPKMSRELGGKSLLAVALSLLAMAIYVGCRFEFPYAVGAMVSLIHDVLVAVGVYCALGNQLSLNIVAAVLTIIGYSINDTIVIFDRIRENVKVSRGKSYREIANESINQTLARTILTTGVTMFSVLALLVFGGGSLRDLTLCLFIGMIAGVYSTVYVATPFVLLFHREKKVTVE
ncbi:MAG: protein translocase subunit SecD [Kiritimatiellaeota bacterium]|nr:protein translocase subunit SecD [Kiritimatiellota bacterium]